VHPGWLDDITILEKHQSGATDRWSDPAVICGGSVSRYSSGPSRREDQPHSAATTDGGPLEDKGLLRHAHRNAPLSGKIIDV